MALALAFSFASSARAENPEGPTTETIARNCTGCHGMDGKSAGKIPALYGKPADELAQKLMDFRDGKKESTVMQRIIKPFADADIRAVAGYFASRK